MKLQLSTGDGLVCTDCRENTFSLGNAHQCQKCPEGATSDAGSSKCGKDGVTKRLKPGMIHFYLVFVEKVQFFFPNNDSRKLTLGYNNI